MFLVISMATYKRDFNFDENILEVISSNVRKYRKAKNITQEQLAVDIDMSYDYLRRFESQNGKEGISLMSLYKISVVLEITMDKFFEK
ncbi:MAG: helix-turn-helix transcriptional regulator [Firmicutes bacterium]|nr:helix-turn-helix transcriptional regulator [Bacillota bacterium]